MGAYYYGQIMEGRIPLTTMIVNEIRQLTLHEKHAAKGAKFGVFGEWEVPLYYSSILEEHDAVRNRAGLFDISHMGEIFIEGTRSIDYLHKLLPRDIEGMKIGKALYVPLLNDGGGIVDDLILYRLGEKEFLMIVNAGNVEKDLDWLRHVRGIIGDYPTSELAIYDLSEKKGLLALQGPRSAEILETMLGISLKEIRNYQCCLSQGLMIARTGYTGEDGFEIMMDLEDLSKIWDRLLDCGGSEGLIPIGFAARDMLRLEAGMLLYGYDMDIETNPVSAGIQWAVDFKKESFVGKEKLVNELKNNPSLALVGFEMKDRGVPRHDYMIQHQGKEIGKVTSGGVSPSLQKNIGLGYVPFDLAKPDNEVEIMIRDKSLKAVIVKLPFYRRRK